MKSFGIMLGAALGLALAAPAAAWNGRGHMIVAAKAWQALSPSSRTAVGRLLRLNPMYKQWTAGVSAADRDRAAFVRSATWPDDIKSAPGYVNDHDDAGPNGARNIGYADCDQHRYWHFKDGPFSTDGTPLEQPREPNAETQIRAFTAALGSPSISDDVKSYDLVWLIHLLGDVHQPLHAASRFSADAPHGDRGGNSVKVCDPQCGHNLHAAWDDSLGNGGDAQAAVAAAAALPSTPPGSDDPSVWLSESLDLAKTVAYGPPVGQGTGPFTLSPAYQAQVRQTAQMRASLAGARLAALIDAAHPTVRGTGAARCGGGGRKQAIHHRRRSHRRHR
jgi:hypothetical protein